MPVPVIDPQKRSDAYKKISPVAGIAEQGLVPDPDVMHTLFARLFAILGPVGILPADTVPSTERMATIAAGLQYAACRLPLYRRVQMRLIGSELTGTGSKIKGRRPGAPGLRV